MESKKFVIAALNYKIEDVVRGSRARRVGSVHHSPVRIKSSRIRKKEPKYASHQKEPPATTPAQKVGNIGAHWQSQ
jgi:hypothetical protein